ncbi:poly glycohydrolase isoform [Favolaschia claudopus]|uniref:poly(ADP-ribose) glycohydrolase n=1 Tax=Favolaschia claudopus TaxID=2862362 RepID=A0AAV9ZWP0_9AGAR
MLQLPSSPETLVLDRFSLTDTQTDAPMPFWGILLQILALPAKSSADLIDILDTIAVTLRGRTDSKNAFLRNFLDTQYKNDRFFQNTAWARCVEVALEMPTLFPEVRLTALSSGNPSLKYSSRQIACLLVHQFLCTLPELPDDKDNSQDLHIWFSSEQPHPKAVNAYLTALYTFFERIDIPSSPISFTLHAAPHTPSIPSSLLFAPISITDIENPSVSLSLLGIPSGACVISANSHIGFGRTASQEEMHIGCTPQSLPAKLLTPPLQPNEVLVLRGCEAVVEMSGYGRTAELRSIVPPGSRRTMLFMDALELDSYDVAASTPDLLPGNVDRELTKAYTAFASGDPPYDPIVTGHWGCGAFGGNREIKSVIQWSAAALTGVRLDFVCDKNDSFARAFRRFTSQALSQQWRVERVIGVLRGMGPTDQGRLTAFETITSALSGASS